MSVVLAAVVQSFLLRLDNVDACIYNTGFNSIIISYHRPQGNQLAWRLLCMQFHRLLSGLQAARHASAKHDSF